MCHTAMWPVAVSSESASAVVAITLSLPSMMARRRAVGDSTAHETERQHRHVATKLTVPRSDALRVMS